LGHRHRDAFPAAAPAEPRSRAWLAILLFGAVAVGLYYAPFLDPYERALVCLVTEGLAIAAVIASLRLNRPARPLEWALFGYGMLSDHPALLVEPMRDAHQEILARQRDVAQDRGQ
jgi:hypothetical protein